MKNPPPSPSNNNDNNTKESTGESTNDTVDSHRQEERNKNKNQEEQKAVLRMAGVLPIHDDDENEKERNHETTQTEGEVATTATSSSRTNKKDKNGEGTIQNHTVIIRGTSNTESKEKTDQTTTKNIKGTKLAAQSSVGELPAADVPVTTELRRQGGSAASRPGAYRQAGINHAAGDIPRHSVSAGNETSQELASGTTNQPPLLTATLVTQPPEVPIAPAESTIVAKAELMPEDDEETKESPTAPPTAPPQSNRKVLYVVIGIALLACIIVGVVTGLVVSNNASNSSNANNSRYPTSNGNVDNENNGINGNTTEGSTTTPTSNDPATATPEDSENHSYDGDENDENDGTIRRVHYLVQWGFGLAGCGQISHPPVDLECANGELEFMAYDGTTVVCDEERCFLNKLPDGSPENGGGSGLAWGQRPPPQGGRRQRRYLQGTPTTTFYNALPEVYLGALLVACVGTVADTLTLSAKVSFRNDRRCDFLWMEEKTAGGTTLQEAHGGGISSSVTVHAICLPDTESPDSADQAKLHFEFSPCLKGATKTLGETNQHKTCITEEPCLNFVNPVCFTRPKDIVAQAQAGNLLQKSCHISGNTIYERPKRWGLNGLWEQSHDYRLRPDDIAAQINTTMDSYVQERLDGQLN